MNSRLFLACLISFAAVGSACGSNSESAPSPSAEQAPHATPTAAPPAAAAPAAPTPAAAPSTSGSDETRALLTRVFHATQTRKMRMRATITIAGGPHAGTSSVVAEMIPPNTKSVVMSGRGGADHAMHMLMSGNNTWMRQSSTAPWRRLPFAPQAGIGGAMPQIEQRILASLESGGGTLERAGEETINGHPCTIYHITWTTAAAPGRPSMPVDGRVWIGNDGLAYKVMSVTRAAETTTFDATYEYDDSLTIELPAQ
ncbi:MAG: hypothetical protein IPK60_08080 [Sandaracinaceae bacterium]|nr:hypothetical protein [Sandaracinaceae bacterium]